MIAPLFVTSAYSFLFGTVQPKALARGAAKLGYESLALTDRNSVCGIPSFIEACKETGIRPIIGTELSYSGGRAILLAKSSSGFSRISTILTARAEAGRVGETGHAAKISGAAAAGRDGFNARSAILLDHEGIIVITDDLELLEGACAQENVGQSFYALMSPFNKSRWRRLLHTKAPCAATGETCFLETADRDTQRVLLAIAGNKTVSDVGEDDCAPAGAVLPAPKDFAAVYSELPEALAANEAIAGAARFSSLFDGFIFPQYRTDEPGGSAALLRRLVLEGAGRRYRIPSKAVLKRIDYELGIIDTKGFSDYFLVVRDIVKRSSRTCGRGSAAASIVSYCLGITDVDPIRYDLYFERFLNPGRKDPPDIDIDFAWDERDALIASVIRDFGEERAARVANHVCFQRRAALHETARAYGMSEAEITAFERHHAMERRTVPFFGSPPLPAGLKGAMAATGDVDDAWAEITRLYPRLVGLPRNLGVHSGGLIVVPDRLAVHVPVERTGSGTRVTVWDKEGVETAGLVKIDLLGNRSLAVVRDALANLAGNGIAIDEDLWHPGDDPGTIDLLARGDTMGVFYVESPAMRILQQKTGRGDFEHLVIHSSIIRPAANRYINEYVDRLNGKPWEPLHPLLDGLFNESFGILCYQEDASKAAVALAGFSAADADGIRKALARKDPEARLQEYWPAFKAGAEGRGVDSGTIDAVWDMIRSFCGYSFVKAHSASYAMLSFKSAYLRRHHPAEFMAAVLSNHGGFYSTLAYVSECRRMGLEVLPPDVNNSELRCRGSGRTIRFGLEMIGSLRAQTASAIVDERRQHGTFASVEDFARRVPCNRSDDEALVGSGALDSVSPGATRAAKLMRILGILAMREAQADPRAGSSLFEEAQVAPLQSSTPSSPLQQAQQALPHQSAAERKRLESEMKYLGTTLAVHPTALWPRAAERPRIRGSELRFHVGQTVELLGWPIIVKQALTASDQLMEFVSFEDETALYETILFPESYQRYQSLLFEERPLFIRGKVEKDRGAITLNVASIEKCPEGIGCNDGKIWIK